MIKHVILPLAILLSGCSPIPPDPPRKTLGVTPDYVRYYMPAADAYEFRLEDGTRCVAYYKSITCEWKTTP